MDLILLTLCAVIAGANTRVEVEAFGRAKKEGLNWSEFESETQDHGRREIRRLALNLLKRESTAKTGIQAKRGIFLTPHPTHP